MTEREDLLQSLAETIADYRVDEIDRRAPTLINDWLQQFTEETQYPLLLALDRVLKRTYVSRSKFRSFLVGLASTDKLSPGNDPRDYWRRVNLLDVQQGGNSQAEIREMFDEILQEIHGFGIDQTGSEDGDFIYLDDCVGTGNRLRSDICGWLEDEAPQRSNIQVITPILFTGSWWIDGKIQEAADENGKTVSLKKWRLDQFQMENRRSYRNKSDVLWPTFLPDLEAVEQYCIDLEGTGHPPVLRFPGNSGASDIFEDDAQKILMEQAFLIRGCEMRRKQANLPATMRPLGYSFLDTLGFGSMFVTYRNCPNNCPLALWVDQDDYPTLFPRKTN